MQFLNTDFLQNEEIKLVVDRLAAGNPDRNWVPAYHFHICDLNGHIMGACDLRIGYTEGLYYGGHIGYSVKEEYQGRHYAAKACKLLFSLAQKHGMRYLYITCNPDNYASRKTCKYLQGEFLGTVELPDGNDMRINEGETQRCIFKFNLYAKEGSTFNQIDGGYSLTVSKFDGRQTLWTDILENSQSVEVEFSFKLTKGRAKIVHIDAEGNITTLIECTPETSTDGYVTKTVSVTSGKKQIKNCWFRL